MNKIEYGTEFLDQLKDSVHDLYEDNKELRELLEYKNDKIERLNKALLDIKEYIETKMLCFVTLKDYQIGKDLLDIVNKALGVDKECK